MPDPNIELDQTSPEQTIPSSLQTRQLDPNIAASSYSSAALECSNALKSPRTKSLSLAARSAISSRGVRRLQLPRLTRHCRHDMMERALRDQTICRRVLQPGQAGIKMDRTTESVGCRSGVRSSQTITRFVIRIGFTTVMATVLCQQNITNHKLYSVRCTIFTWL